MKTSSYVFGAALAVGGICGVSDRANGAVVTAAAFTFEVSGVPINAANVTAAAVGPLVAESGVGTGSALHAGATTVYSSPVGSGSLRSLSANNYVAGDYFQFSVPTTALSGIIVSFDSVASSTGPKVFTLAYSTGGGYSNFANYTLNTGTSTAFSSAATNSAVRFTFDLSAVTGLDNAPLAAFRLVEADTTTATGGTARVDNFVVTGNTVPEPASLSAAVLALSGMAARRRRA